MVDITLPDEAWADVEEGTEALLEDWFVAVGDRVEAGQVVANVMLVKAAHEVLRPPLASSSRSRWPPNRTSRAARSLARLKTG